ncbi:SDR family oxidoreductase [Cytobacillus gottheilii]|uniref:SDR family oxidoreductase n=1 Tax=Cytobacillus gottheilii TaxID=859144 RepID=UPI0009B9C5CF|nr:SDR family oxidoreductase [Cytobacillus gottheilii]
MGKRTALITGGATGIGKMAAIKLAQEGINLVINYRNSQYEAEQLCQHLTTVYNTENICIRGDIANSNDCEILTSQALKEFNSIDILVHNAGPYIHERKKMTDYSLEEWRYLVDGNLNAVFYLSKLLIPQMRNNQWGRIITIGFDRAEASSGWIYRSAFAASKSAVASLTKTIAMEEAKYGITANMVCPGDIVGDWKEKEIEDAISIKDVNTPVGRPGTGEDIARCICFLVEDKSSFITGSIIPVTGGKDVLGKIHRL